MIALPATFGELAEKVIKSLPSAPQVHFVADTYKRDSIKATERSRRGEGDKFLLKGPSTKLPKDWKGFLKNGENKNQLVKFLLSEWRKDIFATVLLDKKLFVNSCTECMLLTSADGKTVECQPINELFSSQEEADTRIILHAIYHSESALTEESIIVRSSDTDVLLLLLYFSSRIGRDIYLDVGVGNNRRLLPITSMATDLGPGMCEIYLGLHAFTGCDSTSSFVTKGKIRPVNTLKRNPQLQPAFKKLGRPDLDTDTEDQLEHFVCCLYGRPKSKSINKTRYDLLRQKFDVGRQRGPLLSNYNGTDLSLLPPCKSSLKMHMQRANYQVGMNHLRDSNVNITCAIDYAGTLGSY